MYSFRDIETLVKNENSARGKSEYCVECTIYVNSYTLLFYTVAPISLSFIVLLWVVVLLGCQCPEQFCLFEDTHTAFA